RGLDAGPAALALEAFEQGGFLAADVGAGAAMDVAIDHELAAGVAITIGQALGAEDAVLVGLFEGLLEDVGLVVVLAADEDVGLVEAAGVAGDGDALEHQVGVVVEQQAVF